MKRFISYNAFTVLIVSVFNSAHTTNSILHGQAYAGRAAIADSSSLFWNAAASGFSNHNEISLYGSYLRPRSKFKLGNGTSSSLLNSSNRNRSKSTFVPAFYAVYKLSDRFKMGIAVTAPFGLITDYGNNWIGRYVSTKTKFEIVNLNPSLSYKVNEQLAVAVGVAFQNTRADLRKNINQSLLNASDILVKLKCKDWKYGFNLGLIYEFSKGTKFGLSYRSYIRHKLKGNVTIQNVNSAFLIPGDPLYTPQLVNGPIRANFKTPEIYNLSLSHELNMNWTVLADIMYTRWKVFKTFSVDQIGINKVAAFVEPQNWKNTFMYSLGVNYKYNDKWLFRLGGAYEETPTRNQYRSTRSPGANRWWSAMGIDYTVNRQCTICLAYTHIFFKKAKINITGAGVLPTQLQGRFKTKLDIIGLQFNYKF